MPEWVSRLYGEKKPSAVVDDLIAERRREGASDRACLALAIDRAVPAWTADRVWLDLDANVEIRASR